MVEWLARWFLERGLTPGIVSRGYKAGQAAQNDEARELSQKLPGVPHVQSPDRVSAAERAIAEFHCRRIILDDGFQHRRLARDLDLVLLDALEPFGFGHVFPRGTLREPPTGLRRAHVVALSRADVLRAEEREAIRREVRELAPATAWIEVRHAPRALLGAAGARVPLQSLVGQPVAAFCGIGNPAGFRHTLASCGYRVDDFREFPDHHPYGRHAIERLADWARELDVAAVVCTQKDLVKLGVEQLGGRPLWALEIGLEILAGREELESRLEALADG
jgi:tetraacyldisaccharide 4'-kinase